MSLAWTQPKWTQRVYELRDGDVVLGTMSFHGKWKSVAHASYGDEKYQISNEGFWKNRVLVKPEGSDSAIADVQTVRGTKEVRFMNGRVFTLKRVGTFWSVTWEFRAPDNDLLLTIRNNNKFLRGGALIETGPNAERYSETKVLVILGWYMMLAAAAQAAASA